MAGGRHLVARVYVGASGLCPAGTLPLCSTRTQQQIRRHHPPPRGSVGYAVEYDDQAGSEPQVISPCQPVSRARHRFQTRRDYLEHL